MAYHNRTKFVYARPSGHFIFRTAKKERTHYSSYAFRAAASVQQRTPLEHVSDIDLKAIVDLFSDNPKKVAKALKDEAAKLIEIYKENSDKDQSSVTKRFQIGENHHYIRNGENCKSHYEIVLNTYGYTWKNQENKPSEITEKDITVKLELVYDVPDSNKTIAYEPLGYRSSFLHFIGLISSDQFAKIVREGKQHLEDHPVGEEKNLSFTDQDNSNNEKTAEG